MGFVLALILVGLKLFSIVNLDWILVTLFSIAFIYADIAVNANNDSRASSALASHIDDHESRISELEERFRGDDDPDDSESYDSDDEP